MGLDPQHLAALRENVVAGFAANYCVASRPALEALLAAYDQVAEKIYRPGVLRCAKCGFRLVSSTLNAVDGTVRPRDTTEHCPNHGAPMWRVSWEEECRASDECWEQQVARAVAAEKSTGASAEIRGGKLEISIDVDALPAIVNGSCCAGGLQGLWKVTDAEVFAKEVCRALNDEAEDGTTRGHTMFDGAFLEAIEQGAEGVEECSEEEFEQISASFQAKPLDDPGRPVPPHGSGP